jgi:glyoxylase I family protein
MFKLNRVHHIAVICTDYERSKHFYTQVIGLTILREVYREQRNSYKLDLGVNGLYQVELFSFPEPPPRPSRPEAAGLRHLAFEVDEIDEAVAHVESYGITVEPIRIDEFTNKRYTFFADPDGLPIEFVEK